MSVELERVQVLVVYWVMRHFTPRHFTPDILTPTLYPRHFTPCIDTVNLSNLQEINGGKVSYPATVYPLFKDQFYSYDTLPPSVLASNVL